MPADAGIQLYDLPGSGIRGNDSTGIDLSLLT
jgi:hypothetical protein